MRHVFLIKENQRGVLFVDGRLSKFLAPGRHVVWSVTRHIHAEIVDLEEIATPVTPALSFEHLVPSADGSVLVVPKDRLALVSRDGVPKAALKTGRYILWDAGLVEVDLVDLRALDTTIPVPFWPLAGSLVYDAIVQDHERAVLFVDGALTRVLGPGRHGLSTHERKLRLSRVDMRAQELQVPGQELITRDKVSLRLNLIVHYRVVDPERLVQVLDGLRDMIYAHAQIAARSTLAALTVDELLEQRGQLSAALIEQLQVAAKSWGVDVISVDIKDVILPGEMKTLLNQVIEAEKRAQAQIILRREEVAATRSLANTARMLEQNPVLLKLKELETYKEIVERIPKLTVVVGDHHLDKLRLSE